MSTTGVGNVIRTLFLFIDRLVYWLVQKIAEIFYLLSRGTVFGQADIDNFANRVYMLVALIVLFRLAFSFVNYIINPDQLTDSQKGGTKLLVKVVTSLILLVMTPTIFNEAYRLQALVIDQDLVGKLVTGQSLNREGMASFGKTLSYGTFRSFLNISEYVYNQYCGTGNDTPIDITSQTCIESINKLIPEKEVAQILQDADRAQSIETISMYDIITDEVTYAGLNEDGVHVEGTVYILDYKFGLSTITGLVIGYLVLSFCFDVAVRMIKLGFLQLIAPVPIVMSLAPGQEKNNSLSKWGKECFSTYISLFIRLMVIYLAFYVINLLIGTTSHGVIDIVTGDNTTGPTGVFVNLFAIIGALLFAKQVPKLIEQMFGLGSGMKLTLNPLKALREAPVVGGAVLGGAALAGGLAGTVAGSVAGLGRALAAGVSGNTGEANLRLRQTGANTLAHLGASFRGAGNYFTNGLTGSGKGPSKGVHALYNDARGNINKDYKSGYEAEALRRKGEQYFEQAKTKGEYGIYHSQEFAKAVENADLAKQARNDAQSAYEMAAKRFDADRESAHDKAYSTYNAMKAYYDQNASQMPEGAQRDELLRIEEARVSAEQSYQESVSKLVSEIDSKRVAYAKAEGDFGKAKDALESSKKIYTEDAQIYSAYSSAADRHKLNENLHKPPTSGTNSGSTSSSNSSSSSSSSGGLLGGGPRQGNL